MFKVYHYTTWPGPEIVQDGLVLPHSVGRGPDWPELVWATELPSWDPSVQAANIEGQWPRFPSCPEQYVDLGIPCWRFTVEVKTLHKLMYPHPRWVDHLRSAKRVRGSRIDKWYWTPNPCKVTEAHKWRINRWEPSDE